MEEYLYSYPYTPIRYASLLESLVTFYMSMLNSLLIVFITGALYFITYFSRMNFWVPYHFLYLRCHCKGSFETCVAWKGKVAQDGEPRSEGIQIQRNIAYGTLKEEKYDLLQPTEPSMQNKLPIVYAHGGGLVACRSEFFFHSLTPFARQGHVCFSLDYPLLPHHRFPTPLFSLMKCLTVVCETHHYDAVILLGDSAGSILVTMVAVILGNPLLWKAFVQEYPEIAALKEKKLPKILQVISLYGIHDQVSWKDPWKKISSPRFSFLSCAWFTYSLAIILRFYAFQSPQLFSSLRFRNGSKTTTTCRPLPQSFNSMSGFTFEGKITVVDLLPYAQHFPSCLILCGENDPLKLSSEEFYRCLKVHGFSPQLRLYDAHHGFFGFPINWSIIPDTWKASAVSATNDILHFMASATATVTASATAS